MKLTKVDEIKNKKKTRLLGKLYFFEDGPTVYVAHKRLKDLALMGKRTLAEALRENCAAWGIEIETLMNMRRKGVDYVGVRVKDTGDLYLTPMRHYADFRLAKLRDGFRKTKHKQKFLPIRHFVKRDGKTVL